MKKSFMNIKNFVDSNVRQRIDRVSNNNNDFFGDDLLTVEKQFDDLRQVCVEAEKRISALLQSFNNSPTTLVGTYTQNVQASLSNLTTSNSNNNSTTSPIPTNTSSPTLSYSHEQGKLLQYGSAQILSNNNNNHGVNDVRNNLTDPSSHSPTLTNISSDNIYNGGDFNRDEMKKHRKLPIVGFLKFLSKFSYKLKADSLLTTTFSHCSKLQKQLTELYLNYELTIDSQCLKPIQRIIECDIPNVIKLRKVFIKSHNDLESIAAKYNLMNQKQHASNQLQQAQGATTNYSVGQTSSQQANIIKLDQLKKEAEDAGTKFEQSKDIYAMELYAFICRETEIIELFMKFYRFQAEYQQQVFSAISSSLPPMTNLLTITPRKAVFGMSLDEHLMHIDRPVALVVEISIHLLYLNGLNEEGLFRIPGSSTKIKKLKNAINAWFISLASQKELKTRSPGSSANNSAAVYAIYNLFKDTVTQRPQLHESTSATSSIESTSPPTIPKTSSLASKDSVENLSSSQSRQHQLVFDVHTIAGLLKLYLRELPEPLLTFDLYDQWISIAVSALKKEMTEISLKETVSQLPKANYDTLRYMIRFFHVLTNHHEQNKMTATNLAITLAPSLIWSKPLEMLKDEENETNDIDIDEMQSLNIQISNIGLSTSLHAVLIENLINHAEILFPGEMQYTLPGFTRASKLSNNKTSRYSTYHLS